MRVKPDLDTDLFPNEERKHPKLRDSAEIKVNFVPCHAERSRRRVTYEYDETAKAGIENVRCGHLELDKVSQSVVCRRRVEEKRDRQDGNA